MKCESCNEELLKWETKRSSDGEYESVLPTENCVLIGIEKKYNGYENYTTVDFRFQCKTCGEIGSTCI